MRTYSFAIEVAVFVFPIIAFLITIPYMLKQYHKYGAIPFLRTLILYSFVLYLLTAYFMVILPLPSITEVASLKTPWAQLVPFRFVGELIMKSGFVINDFSTYLPTIKNPIFYTNLFNLFLLVPFGVYLRYYFNRKWWEVFLLSFLMSLFFEVTQISGLYGIYPRPYRLFDVDDLIINTLGGTFGYLITPIFSFILPSRKRLDEMAYEKGKRVSFSRRVLAYLIDYLSFTIIIFIATSIFKISVNLDIYFLMYLIYFLCSVIIFDGRTLGKTLVRIKVVSEDGKRAKVYQLLARYISRYIIFYKIYDIINWSRRICLDNGIVSLISVIIIVMTFIIYFKTAISIITKKEQLVYEKISKTKNVSTIKYKTKDNDNKKELVIIDNNNQKKNDDKH